LWYESPEYQKDRLGIMVAKIPARFLLDPTIDENVKSQEGWIEFE
jgi:hypothetical protein